MQTAKTDQTGLILSIHWAHMPFCWFCHDAAQMAYYSPALKKWGYIGFALCFRDSVTFQMKIVCHFSHELFCLEG